MGWSKSPALFTDVITKDIVKKQKSILTDLIYAIVDHSPVDTSRFASNNRISVGSRGSVFIESDFSGKTAAISRALSEIKKLPLDQLQDVWIYNDTPYGIYLEDTARYRGSPQSPNGVYLVSFLGVATWHK